MYPNDFIKEYRYYLGRRIDVSYAQVLGIRVLPIGQLCEGTCQSSISTIEVKGVGLNPTGSRWVLWC